MLQGMDLLVAQAFFECKGNVAVEFVIRFVDDRDAQDGQLANFAAQQALSRASFLQQICIHIECVRYEPYFLCQR